MNDKHTLLSLCQKYDKIEIPIIQRDYAQGRKEQENLRNKFVNYLVKSLANQTAIELDFVYGNIRIDFDSKQHNKEIHTFVPIDGQQRLTTLWLLHWFLSVKESRLTEISEWMMKFSYETRPSSHDFCHRLLTEQFPAEELTKIDEFIENQGWFDNEWYHDGTVRGMLCMLKAFGQHQELLDGTIKLNQLLHENVISFYFVPLKQFGLSEDLYIRMNARGKILTDFENFKSEFYKILKDNPFLEEVKNKMESSWVENLWPYRKKDTYVTDDNFMNFLKFITRMLYFSQAKPRAEKYATDFLDMDLLRDIYSQPDNANFLFYALDVIPELNKVKTNNLLWEKSYTTTLSDIISNAIQGSNMTIDKMIILYASLLFFRKHKSNKLNDFIRVTRNLIFNTNDKSERDQPRILKSFEKLSENADVYETLSQDNFNLEGLRDSQCKEEHFKALLVRKFLESKELLFRMEDNSNLCGKISPLLAGVFVSKEDEIASFIFKDSNIKDFDLERLRGIYNCYEIISDVDFELVWGDLINTNLYIHEKTVGRLVYRVDHPHNPAIIALAVSFFDSGIKDLDKFLISTEKQTIIKLQSEYKDFSTTRNVKLQLYLYYVITRRIMLKEVYDFFKNGWNFGWLSKENGFSSCFSDGIENDPWFHSINPIFQTYNSQFRYNCGLNEDHALPTEIVGNGRPQKVFDRLIEWANK